MNLIYLLNCLFKNVDVFKPATSKEGNSEVYVVCQCYKPEDNTHNYLELIKNSDFNTEEKMLFSQEMIPKSFIEQLKECAEFFMNIQINVIERNLKSFDIKSSHTNEDLTDLKRKIRKAYYSKCRLKPIGVKFRILHPRALEKHKYLNPRQHFGSYNEMKSQGNSTDFTKYLNLQDRLGQLWMSTSLSGETLVQPFDRETLPHLNICRGKPIEMLLSSKFIYLPNLKLFLEVIALTKDRIIPTTSVIPIKKISESNHTLLNIDLKSYLAYPTYNDFEKSITLEILKTVCEMPEKHDLFIYKLPILTQFLAGLIYYIGRHTFEKIHLYLDGRVLLESKKIESMNKINELSEILRSEGHPETTIIGLLDLKMLCSTSFYDAVINYNTSLVLQYSSQYLVLFEKEKSP